METVALNEAFTWIAITGGVLGAAALITFVLYKANLLPD